MASIRRMRKKVAFFNVLKCIVSVVLDAVFKRSHVFKEEHAHIIADSVRLDHKCRIGQNEQ
jgi:hypothetical protein